MNIEKNTTPQPDNKLKTGEPRFGIAVCDEKGKVTQVIMQSKKAARIKLLAAQINGFLKFYSTDKNDGPI